MSMLISYPCRSQIELRYGQELSKLAHSVLGRGEMGWDTSYFLTCFSSSSFHILNFSKYPNERCRRKYKFLYNPCLTWKFEIMINSNDIFGIIFILLLIYTFSWYYIHYRTLQSSLEALQKGENFSRFASINEIS